MKEDFVNKNEFQLAMSQIAQQLKMFEELARKLGYEWSQDAGCWTTKEALDEFREKVKKDANGVSRSDTRRAQRLAG